MVTLNGAQSDMESITTAAIAAKHEHPRARCVCAIVIREGVVITRRVAPGLEVIREDGQPARVEPLRDVRPSIDGPNPQRVAEVPKGAA